MTKKFTAFISAFLILFSSLPVFAQKDYDEVGAYNQCCLLYPEFVQKVRDNGATDERITAFLASVEKKLLTFEEELGEKLDEENFDQYMFDSIKYAFSLRKHILVRNALSAAYPDSIVDAMDGVVTEEFMPIYDTVKRFLFGITTPVITISTKLVDGETIVYAHSAYLPENTRFILALYDSDGILLHAKNVTPNCEEDGIHCSCSSATAKLFAWEKSSLNPICSPYETAMKNAPAN